MICTDVQEPIYLIFSSSTPGLIYYSHLPTAIVALIVGLFVFLKSRDLASRLLFSVAVIFFLWNLSNLILWTNIDSDVVMFVWSLTGIFEVILFAAVFYFLCVFINGRDISLKYKLLGSIFLMPFIIWNYNSATDFNIVDCEAIQKNAYVYSIYTFDLLVFFGVLTFSFFRYIKEKDSKFKKQIMLFAIGIELFLSMFFISGMISNVLYEMGFDYAFQVEQYGLFGMPIFIAFLAYLIVKYKAFHIKLAGAQALVYALVISIGSQFFFIQSRTNQILTGITLAMAVGFGIFLIRSVKAEILRKEELQHITEKLAIANDELRKLDNAKSEFISIASHQLRTPLTAIKGYVSLLLEGTYGEIGENVLDPIRKVHSSNERLIQLVEDLLNVSRIESGRMEFVFGKASVETIVRALEDTFSVIARKRGLYLTLKLPDEPLPEVEIDPGKTREVISNLIDNALKYTKRGGVTVKVELVKGMDWTVKHMGGQEENLSGDVVRTTISDTGIGVPESEIPYLFSKFSRGKDTSRLNVGGNGLGLYVGKNIIEAQHGRIWVESKGLSKGSKFFVDLPVDQPKK